MASSTTAAQKRAATRKVTQKPEIDPLFFETRVVENNLHADTAEGEIVLPLSLKTKTYRAMADSGLNGLEQLIEFVVLPAPGGKGLVAKIEELDVFVALKLQEAWFHAVMNREDVKSLGESAGSQPS